jgi:poly(beta-D-mannuronate) C5 epimerase
MATATAFAQRTGRSKPQFSRRLGVYALIIVTVAAAAAIVSFTYGLKVRSVPPFPAQIARAPFVPAEEPILAAESGLPANTRLTASPTPSSSVRLILMLHNKVLLLRGGQIYKSYPFSERTITALASRVNNRSWMDESKSGVVTLNAALVVSRGAQLHISGISRLSLNNKVGVFLGTLAGKITIAGVHVTVTGSSKKSYRPFILADEKSTLDISDSTIKGLGWNWDSSYGVAWMHGSQGDVINSTIEDNYIGVFTDHAKSVTLRHDTVSDNVLYGINPNDHTTNFSVLSSDVDGNGGHGIIFARSVTSSSVRDSVVNRNGEDGIMLFDSSSKNVIQSNTVEGNAGDGVGITNSASINVVRNAVRNNRDGIDVVGQSPNVVATDNTLTDNAAGGQGIALSSSNVVKAALGPRLNLTRVRDVWEVAGALALVLMLATLVLRFRRSRSLVRLGYGD